MPSGAKRGIGDLLREHRRRAGLTQHEVATLSAISVSSVRDLEQGRVLRPRMSTLRKLAGALNLTQTDREALTKAGAGADDDGVWVGVLGPLQVVVDGVAVDPGSETQRTLLGLLALSPNEVIGRDALIDLLFGASPPVGAIEVLQTRVSRLRRRLVGADAGPEVLASVRGGYQLAVTEENHDLLQFRRLLRQARRASQGGERTDACASYEDAMRLWRGEPLAGLPVLQSHPAVVGLVEEWKTAVVDYAGTAAELARFEVALPWLQRVVEADPLHERAHAALMVTLAGSGQQAAALSLFDSLRRRLADELGADPCPEVMAAYQRVLHQEVKRPEFAPVSAHHQLPPDIADFTGRDEEVQALLEHIRPAGGASTAVVISSIEGMGGVGKTKLAVHVAHRLLASGRYLDQQLYVDLHGHADEPPADPGAVLASFLHLLGVPGDKIPQRVDERSALYRDRLWDREALVILDNAAGEDQVLPLLPAGPSNVALITSRRTLALDGVRTLPLKVFTLDEARELLTQVVGRERVDSDLFAADGVIELCGRLPLAIALAGRRLQSRPAWGFGDLAERLTEAGDLSGELAAGHRRLRVVFDLSYQALDDEQKRMFRLLGLFPGDDFTADTAAALAAREIRHARTVLEQLEDEHLITMVTGQAYSMHDLLRDYARREVEETESERDRSEAISRLLDFYLHSTARAADLLQPNRARIELTGSAPAHGPDLVTSSQARNWLENERANLIAAVNLAAEEGWSTHAWQLAYSIREFLYLYGYTKDWERTHESTLKAALAAEDLVGEAVTRAYLAASYMNDGRSDEARDQLHRALELHRAAGNRAMEAGVLGSLGILYYRLGQFSDALGYFQTAAALCAGEDPLREGVLRTNIGIILTTLGRIDEAFEYFRTGLELSRRVGNADGESCVLADLGDAHRRLGSYGRSLEHLENALAVATGNGLVPKEAYVRHRLGNTYREMGRLDDALSNLNEALRIVRTVAGPATESEVLINLGAVHRDAGEFDVAEELIKQGLKLATSRAEHYQEARALDGLAAVYERAASREIAEEYWRMAHTMFADLGTPEASEIGVRLRPQSTRFD